MRILVVLTLLLGGCSWVTARANNKPHIGCSRTNGRIDSVLALVGVAGLVTSIAIITLDPPGEGDHAGKRPTFAIRAGASSLFAIIEGFQASYGLRVADRCQAARAKLMMTTAPGSL